MSVANLASLGTGLSRIKRWRAVPEGPSLSRSMACLKTHSPGRVVEGQSEITRLLEGGGCGVNSNDSSEPIGGFSPSVLSTLIDLADLQKGKRRRFRGDSMQASP